MEGIKPVFKAMYIYRHDLDMRLALKAISKGDHGGYYTIADVGRAEVVRDMGVSSIRLSTWLLPNSCLSMAGIDPTDRILVRTRVKVQYYVDANDTH